MGRIRFIVIGAVIGLTGLPACAASCKQLAGPDSTFTFAGTFAVIIPTGTIVGALLGWAEYQRRQPGHQYQLLILAPLLIGIIPNVVTARVRPRPPVGPLALLAMIGGYAISGRGPPRWARPCSWPSRWPVPSRCGPHVRPAPGRPRLAAAAGPRWSA